MKLFEQILNFRFLLDSYKWKLGFLLFLFFIYINIGAQSDDLLIQLDHIGLGQGLSNRNVRSVIKDDQGYLWLSTEAGLNKFNGKSFKNFDTFSSDIRDDNIEDSFMDKEGNLWLIHGSIYNFISIEVFDPIAENFKDFDEVYDVEKSVNPSEIVYYRKKGDKIVFVNSNNEIILYDGEFHKYPLPQNQIGKLIYLDLNPENDCWLSYKSKDNGSMINVIFDAQGQVKNRHIQKESADFSFVHKTDEDYFYYFINNPSSGEIYFYKMDTGGNTSQDDISEKRLENIKEYLVFSEEHSALSFFDDYVLFSIGEFQGLHGLSSNTTYWLKDLDPEFFAWHEIYTDYKNTHWFATHFGLFALTINKNKFDNYSKGGVSKTHSIRNIYPENDSTIWIVRDQVKELYRLSLRRMDDKHNLIDSFSHLIENPQQIPWSLYHTLSGNNEDGISFMMNGSLVSFDPKTLDLDIDPAILDGAKYYGVWLLHFGSDEKVWIADDRANLYRMSAGVTKKVIQLPNDKSLCQVYDLYENDIDQFFIVSDVGLFVYDPQANKIISHFSNHGKDRLYLPCRAVYHIEKAEKDLFWLATDNGLIKWSDQTGVIDHFDMTKGLSSNTIYAVYPDDYGALWLPSSFGIMRFDPSLNLVNAFLEENGISNNEFNRLAHAKSPDGTMLFGSLDGMISFHPKDFVGAQNNPGFVIRINRIEQFIKSQNGLVEISNEVRKSMEIILSESDPFVKLDFDLLTYDFEGGERLAFKIEGLDDFWQYQDQNYLRINRLPYGKYQLLVKGIDYKGQFSNNQISIDIRSIKPFYKRGWFISLVILMLLAGISLFALLRIINLRKRQLVLEQKIKERTATIESDKKIIEGQAKELGKMIKSKDLFINNIAHELRTPLTLIKGPIDMIINKSMEKASAFKLLKTIQFNTDKLANLVSDLVQISLLEVGARKPKPSVFYLYKFVKDILSSMEFIAQEKEVHFSLDYKIDKEIYHEFDVNNLEKILTNLLSNAIKFSPLNGQITAIIEQEKGELLIRVKDEGPGVPEEDKEKIFQRYYQSQTSWKKQGLGVGLNYSLSLAKNMGGDLVLEQSSSNGATFLLKLPNRVSQSIPKNHLEVKKDKVPEHHPDENLTVLIVEDNFELQDFLDVTLREHYRIIKANNGLVAFEMLESRSIDALPDIIISDIMMPEMDGIELLKKLRSHKIFFSIPVIILSAKTGIKDKLTAFRIGIDDYITKPFNSDELFVRLNNIGKRIQQRKMFKNKIYDSRVEVSSDNAWLIELQETVEGNIINHQLNVNFVAEKLELSRMHLTRKIKEFLGITPAEYIREVKLHFAREQLSKGVSINEVSDALGYSKVTYFKKIYGERFGIRL